MPATALIPPQPDSSPPGVVVLVLPRELVVALDSRAAQLNTTRDALIQKALLAVLEAKQ